jgi:outer membrane immunogenic protein
MVYDWSGFYIGGNAGWGQARACWDFIDAFGNVFNEGCRNGSGGMVGGQLGYRWQTGGFVFGLEGQGDWANFRSSRVSLINPAFIEQTKVDAVGLITGQVGYAWNNVLWYVKGGAAVAGDKYNGQLLGIVVDTASETRWGGAVGTGVEVGFAPNWSVALEYDHLFMGSRNVNFTATANGAFSRTDNVKQDMDIGTVRVNYRWGGPVIAKY